MIPSTDVARYSANGVIVAVEESANIVLVFPESGGETRRTVTDVRRLIAGLEAALVERDRVEADLAASSPQTQHDVRMAAADASLRRAGLA